MGSFEKPPIGGTGWGRAGLRTSGYSAGAAPKDMAPPPQAQGKFATQAPRRMLSWAPMAKGKSSPTMAELLRSKEARDQLTLPQLWDLYETVKRPLVPSPR